ncbi:hypothetical protein H0H81_011417 [Sphagnurus paluster]|uniref:DNA mismatch repair protein PMS1 n=1 Tax=Sphagnurus paluster TaxID=117069 RepID=A0A9P7FU64_9AGAR|nr:hypothetical protein H0H81_011417 [Sphagnurus paluster]
MSQNGAIKPIDKTSIHRITSGQVVIDLQTAVKELVENSLDAGATNIEVRFRQYGLKSIEVIDNGSGVAEEYHDSLALKHYTSKLSSFLDLSTVRTFGFRGEALSSLCALSESLNVTTTTEPPMGVILEMAASGKVVKRTKVARQRGTTVAITNLFAPLPVRRKEFERNAKREFGKALGLLNAYALGPCCTAGAGVKLSVSNQVEKGQKTVQLRTSGATSTRSSVSALWGPKALDNIVDLDLTFQVDRDKISLKRVQSHTDLAADTDPVEVSVKGLISKFTVGGGRTGTDRQFFYVNGRPCNLTKIQKAFNEVYRSFNANQAPFILADFIIPTDSCDINVSPDKRTIFLHSENNLITQLKIALEDSFATSRATFTVGNAQPMAQSTLPTTTLKRTRSDPESVGDGEEPSKKRPTRKPSTPGQSGALADHDDDAMSELQSEALGSGGHRPSASSGVRASSPSVASEHVLSPTITQMVDADRTASNLPSASARRKPPSPLPSSPRPDSPRHPEVPRNRSLSPTVSQMVNARRTAQDDAMEVDEGAPTVESPAVPRSVVIDTTKAAWSRTSTVPDDPIYDTEDSRSRKNDKPIFSVVDSRKAGSGNAGSGKADKQKKKPAPPKAARDNMRTRLATFARTGSQIPPSQSVENDEEEADEQPKSADVDEEDEDEELDELDPSDGCEPAKESGAGVDLNEDGESELRPSTPIQDVNMESGSSFGKAIDLTSDGDTGNSQVAPTLSSTSSAEKEAVAHPEVIRNAESSSGEVTLRFNLSKISDTWQRLRESATSAEVNTTAQPKVPSDAGVSNIEDGERAADALARVFDKQDFANMEILGQFNLGFIVARRRKVAAADEGEVAMDDLFVVDQHAADEKYNFETLQQTTSIQSQKLFRPQPMELTASDELLAIENMDVLRQNGFEVEEVQDLQGTRLQLTAQPVSKSTVFDMKDLEELIHLMRDRPTGQMVRCSKARAMFAMRACRKSVMVGMPLNRHQMCSVVRHMGTMDQPWNCPHGRPTMRHLLDLRDPQILRRPSRGVDWNNLHV